MEIQRRELVEFEDIEGMRRRADATMTALTELKSQYLRRRNGMQTQVNLGRTFSEGSCSPV
jgi:hypothetical protein